MRTGRYTKHWYRDFTFTLLGFDILISIQKSNHKVIIPVTIEE